MKKLVEFQNAIKQSPMTLSVMGTMIGAMGLTYVKNIPQAVLGVSVDVIKNADMNRAQVCRSRCVWTFRPATHHQSNPVVESSIPGKACFVQTEHVLSLRYFES